MGLFIYGLILFPVLAIAQELPPDFASNNEALAGLLAMLGGIGALKGLGIVVFIVQALMLVVRAPMSAFLGKWKLVVLSLLTTVGAWLVLKQQGMPLLESLLHGSVLSAVQVFAHQLFKQFTEKQA
jgi:hypothetical protein